MTRLLFVYVSIQMKPKFCCFLAIFPLSAPSCRHWPLFLIFFIFYFRRWIYDEVIIGLYVHSNGTRILLFDGHFAPFCPFLPPLTTFLIFFIFYFRRWIYDHVNTGIIGLYVHVHSNGTRTFPRDVKVPYIYYVSTFSGILDPLPTM